MHKLIPLLALSLAAPAQTQDLKQELTICAGLKSKSERVACFEAISRSANAPATAAAPAATPTPAPTAPVASAPAAAPAPAAPAPASSAEFGREKVTLPARPAKSAQPARPSRVQAQVASVSQFMPDRWRITLTDGATWQFSEPVPSYRPPSSRDTVEILRGALGSYLLDFDHQTPVRITRIQ